MSYDFFYDLITTKIVLKMSNIEKRFSVKIQNAATTKTKKKCTLQSMQHSLYVIKTENIFCSFSRLLVAAETFAEIALTLKLHHISH